MNEDIFMKRLKERLLIEFKKQDRSGVYGYTQRSMAYNSNRIEGSTLTEKQTASMFETGTLYTDDTEVIFRAKDIEEMNGHFKMFNYIMKNIEAPLDEDLIKGMHRNLKEGVFEDFANGYAIGDWKKRENRVSDINVALPQEVPEKIHNLIEEYNNSNEVSIDKIAKFHAQFELIHPFGDGNGRVGRMIMFKECLRNNIMPFIVLDNDKPYYMRGLKNYKEDKMFLIDTIRYEQDLYENIVNEMLDFDLGDK